MTKKQKCHKNLTIFLIYQMIIAVTISLPCLSKTIKDIEGEKRIYLQIPILSTIKGVSVFNKSFYILAYNNHIFSIYEYIEGEGDINKLSGKGLDSLKGVTNFFKSDIGFDFFIYNPESRSFTFFVLNDSLHETHRAEIPIGDYTVFKSLPGENRYFYYTHGLPTNKDIRQTPDNVGVLIYSVKSWPKNYIICKVRKELKPTPHRGVNFMFECTPSSIVTCFDDSYKIYVSDLNGKKTKTFTHPTFKNYPYTEDELSRLSPMRAALSRQFDPYPPIIDHIEYFQKSILVFRKQRPGQKQIIIDQFGMDGTFIKTKEIELQEEQYVSSFVYNNNLAILTKNQKGFVILLFKAL